MAKPATAGGATPLRRSLPEEIIFWEILVCLPPKSLLRCRSVCHAWRRATTTHDFLLAHHGRQPSLPIVSGYEYRGTRYENLHALDHRAAAAAHLQPVAGLDDSYPAASCEGILVLSKPGVTGSCFSVFNPTTRQHAPLRQLSGLRFSLLGMYRHRPTGEHRLLLHRALAEGADLPPKDQTGCYVFTLGSDQPPRYIGGLKAAAPADLHMPALLRDSLHWYPPHYRTGSKLVIVFDTASESFRHMPAPAVPANSYIFEMDATLGIYNHNDGKKTVDIWVLRNYETQVWAHEYRVELPVEGIKGKFGRFKGSSSAVSVVSVDGDVLLLVSQGGWMFYVDSGGKLVDSFHRDGQIFYDCELRLKQTLVPHNFFTTLECYALNASPCV